MSRRQSLDKPGNWELLQNVTCEEKERTEKVCVCSGEKVKKERKKKKETKTSQWLRIILVCYRNARCGNDMFMSRSKH